MWATLLLPLNPDDTIDSGRLEDQVDFLMGGSASGSPGAQRDPGDPARLASAERRRGTGFPDPGGSHARPLGALQPAACEDLGRPELLGRLADAVPTLIGLKTAGGDRAWFEAVKQAAPGLSIFVPGHLLASMSPLGAHGTYSNVAALSPAGAVRWYDQIHSDHAAAMDVERRIGVFFAGHIAPFQAAGLSNPALDKFLAAVGGWADAGTRVRWPMSFATEEHVDAARPAARELLPELFPRDW